MAAELVFYTNPMSRGRTIRWMLEEITRFRKRAWRRRLAPGPTITVGCSLPPVRWRRRPSIVQ